MKFYQAYKINKDIWRAHINRNAKENIPKANNYSHDIAYTINTSRIFGYDDKLNILDIDENKSEFVHVEELLANEVVIIKVDKVFEKLNDQPKNIWMDHSDEGRFKQRIKLIGEPLESIGNNILQGIRSYKTKGQLLHFPRNDVFVEIPGKFWSIKLQESIPNFKITVRGSLKDFQRLGTNLEIKKDRGSYCRFYVSAKWQVDNAIKIISEARLH